MFRNLYVGAGSFLILAYLGWSLMGMEWNRSSPEPVPTIKAAYGSSSSGRARYGYYGSSSGFGFGK